MNRAKPTDMRKAMVIVHGLKTAGILFVPMPVLNDKDGNSLPDEYFRRLDVVEKQAEEEELVRGMD